MSPLLWDVKHSLDADGEPFCLGCPLSDKVCPAAVRF